MMFYKAQYIKKITYTIIVSFENGHNFCDTCNYSCHRSISGGGSGTGSSNHSCSSKSLSSTSLSAILSINWPQTKPYLQNNFIQIGHNISSEIFKVTKYS